MSLILQLAELGTNYKTYTFVSCFSPRCWNLLLNLIPEYEGGHTFQDANITGKAIGPGLFCEFQGLPEMFIHETLGNLWERKFNTKNEMLTAVRNIKSQLKNNYEKC